MFEDKKITTEEMNSRDVEGHAPTLGNDVLFNQRIFDKLPKFIVSKYNALITAISGKFNGVDSNINDLSGRLNQEEARKPKFGAIQTNHDLKYSQWTAPGDGMAYLRLMQYTSTGYGLAYVKHTGHNDIIASLKTENGAQTIISIPIIKGRQYRIDYQHNVGHLYLYFIPFE